jgi:hypothetical protein
MKFLIISFVTLFSVSVLADDALQGTTTDIAPTPTRSRDSDFSQFFQIQGGVFSPKSVVVSNGDYKFDYDSDATQTWSVEAGWGIRLFRFLGAFHLQENLGFTSLQGQSPENIRGVNEVQNLNLYLIGLDTRLMYSMEWFPWHRLIPYVNGGYRYTFYNQTGPSDLESVQGGVGNAAFGAGFRFWLNRGSFTTDEFAVGLTTIPIFLVGSYSHLFSSNQDMDLASDSYLAGLAIAL